MSENIIIQPNKPLFVKLSDPMNTDNFNLETREGKLETSTGQVLTLPRPAVLRLYILEPAHGEELEILKKWSGRRGDPAIWSVRRAQEADSAPGDRTPPDSPAQAFKTPQEAPTPINRPSKRQPAAETQPALFDKGTGTYGPMPAGRAYAAPKPQLVPA